MTGRGPAMPSSSLLSNLTSSPIPPPVLQPEGHCTSLLQVPETFSDAAVSPPSLAY